MDFTRILPAHEGVHKEGQHPAAQRTGQSLAGRRLPAPIPSLSTQPRNAPESSLPIPRPTFVIPASCGEQDDPLSPEQPAQLKASRLRGSSWMKCAGTNRVSFRRLTILRDEVGSEGVELASFARFPQVFAAAVASS